MVNMTDWSLIERVDLFPKRDMDLMDFPTVNYESHNARPYKYVYMIGYDKVPNVIIKVRPTYLSM